jgi:basic membrane protein A and related proteins
LRGKKLALVAAVVALALMALAGGGFAMTNVAGHSTAKAPANAAKANAKFKVGLVTDIGGLNDRGFNQLANKGLQQAVKQLKIQGRVLTSSQESDYIPNFTSLVRGGYNLIIGVGFLQTDALNTMATKFPKSHFAGVDVGVNDTKSKPKNYEGLLFKEQEVGYLAGYLAALKAKNSGRVVSTVGGIKLPSVDRYIAGFQAGAKKAVPGTKTLNAYSQDFVDQAKCKEIALGQIGQGSRVVFQVAGGCGLGALDAAKSKGVCGIGVDNDQRFLGAHILTSAQKKVDKAVFLAIKNAKAGKFKGGKDNVFGLKNGGVGLGKFGAGNCAVPKAWQKAVNKIAAQIKAGKIKPPTLVP